MMTLRIHPMLGVILLGVPIFAAPLPREVKQSSIYFPTTVGAKWVYETVGDGLESVVVSEVEKKGNDTIVSRKGVDGTQTIYADTIVSDEGLLQERELAVGKPCWVVRTKLKSGESWDVPEGGKRTVYGPEEIVVPAGKFQALRVVWEQAGGTYTSWYAPGVGEVKRVTKRWDTETVLRSLKSFQAGIEKK